MAFWLRFAHQGSIGIGMIDKDTIQVCSGDPFAGAKPTGERLAIASTTGSLWMSDDSGDSWRLVTSDLPPVFSLDWA